MNAGYKSRCLRPLPSAQSSAHCTLGVVVEEHGAVQDGQVVLGPVPQLVQVLVVQGKEGEVPGGQSRRIDYNQSHTLTDIYPITLTHTHTHIPNHTHIHLYTSTHRPSHVLSA